MFVFFPRHLVQQKGCDNADLEADDDIFFQPEVMAFISQVECK